MGGRENEREQKGGRRRRRSDGRAGMAWGERERLGAAEEEKCKGTGKKGADMETAKREEAKQRQEGWEELRKKRQ